MKNRRKFLLTLTAGIVAAVVIITPVIAEEFFGLITNVDLEGKKLTVLTKKGELEIKVTNTTEISSGKGQAKLEGLAKYVKSKQEAGKKGAPAQITAEDNVASKVFLGPFQKKEGN
jgi:hypothetical protein